ncbi:hypothetical protein FFRU_220070 [Fructobacillus fructosus]|uniref:hypothetical protein n=1 Tax=Fructobacillus fructosus TaxID=1631 RepID=UPI0002195CAB|nr:hypothetical protein [Fructobacillus fructosus]KRN51704.1 hypothetical protein IV71_GL000542 [Fructobacillus fructosus KCTC 3544]GAP01998.1 hypothetical protein FFRU_220070 [Fructobacillus fructosus]
MSSETDLKMHGKKIADGFRGENPYYWRTVNGFWLVKDNISGMVTSDVNLNKAIKITETEAKKTDYEFEKLTPYEKKP